MDTREAYNAWASQYDSNANKTRDLEAKALQATLGGLAFDRYLEIGCGTGKNTSWLVNKTTQITAVDQSEEMMAIAQKKINTSVVNFVQADITGPWTFVEAPYDVVGFSLVLEHIEDIYPIMEKAAGALKPGGYVYIGELHPYKQYSGSKARFETNEGTQVVNCFNHHISEFIEAGKSNGLSLADLGEYFDDNDRSGIPRILTILMRKL